MPLVTTLIDDKSPLIHYDDSWAPGNSQDDASADEYYLGTFTTCNITNGVATFSFNGSSFSIYGAKRVNHAGYTVNVDDNTFSFNGGSATSIFQTPIFSENVTQGTHSVSLTNTGTNSDYVDIDLIVWQSEVGEADDVLTDEIVQDTDPRFNYQGPAWTNTPADPSRANFFSNGTGHSTSTANAVFTFTFTADVMSLFGTVGPQNGPYSVQLDGGQPQTYNAANFLFFSQVMLYHVDNVGPGQHQITVTNLPDVAGQYLNIDYAQLSVLASNNANSSGSTTPNGTSATDASTHLGSGAIAGIAVASVVALAALLAAFIFYRRWRAVQSAQQDLYRIYSPQQPPSAGISSSIQTRATESFIRNGTSSNGTSQGGRSYQQPDYGYQSARYNDHPHNIPATMSDARLPTLVEMGNSLNDNSQSPTDENTRRPLPYVPAGLEHTSSEELAKLAAIRRADDDDTRTVMSELPPPNYGQATTRRG